MKHILLLIIMSFALGKVEAEEKSYEVPWVEELPDGVIAWQQSGLLEDKRETRFKAYNQAAAEKLILDATAERGVSLEKNAPERETAFRAAYDTRGVGIYIEAREPLMRDLLDAAVDPASPGRNESLEVFFSPGLQEVPYYQMFIRTLENNTTFYDWGSPHKNYRTLEDHVHVEAKPLKTGFGVSIFIPWEAIYEYLPWKSEAWRFSIIRWMPFGKAGGVTWGGKVHETGRFGLLHFKQPTKEQQLKIERRLARYAWFHFLARSKEAVKFWSDERIGDMEFYHQVLQPVVEEYTRLGESFGEPDTWTSENLEKIKPVKKDWLEFHYKVSELRKEFLMDKRFSDASF